MTWPSTAQIVAPVESSDEPPAAEVLEAHTSETDLADVVELARLDEPEVEAEPDVEADDAEFADSEADEADVFEFSWPSPIALDDTPDEDHAEEDAELQAAEVVAVDIFGIASPWAVGPAVTADAPTVEIELEPTFLEPTFSEDDDLQEPEEERDPEPDLTTEPLAYLPTLPQNLADEPPHADAEHLEHDDDIDFSADDGLQCRGGRGAGGRGSG